MKKNILVILTIFILGLSITACGSKQVSDDETLIYGSSDYTAINPALYEHGEINSLIFLGLTTHNGENEVVPAAAQSWNFDKDTNTYTFKIREGLTFHDGDDLTAEDAAFTIEAIMDPDNGSENASNFEDVISVKAVDDTTLKLKLSAPNVAMLDYLTIGILPKHLLEGKDMTADSFNQNPVGAGPYKLTDWQHGQAITMEKFEEFYLGEPDIDKVIFKIVEDTDARALQLENGELDFTQITPKAIDRFKDNEEISVYQMKTSDYRGIMYNFNSQFFSKHDELPAAFSYAVDRQAIVDSVLLGHGEIAYSPLQMSDYNNSDVNKYEYNPDTAKSMLEASGWKQNTEGIYEKNGEPLSFTINCGQGDQVRIDMANICAQNLNEIGCDVKVEVPAEVDWENQDAYLIGWGSPYDPDDHTYKVFGTDKGANYSSYSNERVDTLLQQARQMENGQERTNKYKEFQSEMADDPAYTYLAYIDAIYAGYNNISGMTEEQILGHHGVGIFWNIYEWEKGTLNVDN